MKTPHTHVFHLARPRGSILRCACGAWKFSQYAGPKIVNQPPPRKGAQS